MHPDSQNHTTFDVSVGESAVGTANRRLRSSLETSFRDVRAQSADAAPEQRRELRASLREICADARRAGLRAEQLLVLIKEVWSAMPAGISRVQSVHGDDRLNYVISTCVDEYYGSNGDGSNVEGSSIVSDDPLPEREALP
ncbi:MAG TPA: hypothetical protein VK511_07475 [Gemmatimonadaceae bacterium]|nr:hypothetical protein [Gemmatimonadaceae bacterium]